MTGRISTADLKRMFAEAARCLREQHQRLSQLDSIAGDGDHGVAMLRTAEQMEAAAQDEASQSPGAFLRDGGGRVLNVDGGASTALLGAFFTGMADAAGESDLDCEMLAAIFESGMNAVLKQTRARPGDKTMVDALAPAVAATRAAAASGAPVANALEQAAAAARAGAESTELLVARYGRAKFQGQKTLGHMDAGAASVALLFHGFSLAFAAQQEMDHGGH
jgi:phosphoenolpyruvate---glycerone phosphotransferase subunit DhaL